MCLAQGAAAVLLDEAFTGPNGGVITNWFHDSNAGTFYYNNNQAYCSDSSYQIFTSSFPGTSLAQGEWLTVSFNYTAESNNIASVWVSLFTGTPASNNSWNQYTHPNGVSTTWKGYSGSLATANVPGMHYFLRTEGTTADWHPYATWDVPAVFSASDTVSSTIPTGSPRAGQLVVSNAGPSVVLTLLEGPDAGSLVPVFTATDASASRMTNGYNVVAFEVHSSTKTRIRYDNVRVEHGTSVPVPVSIATQPTNTTVIEGGVLSLSVVAAGTPPYTYQWMREGASLPGATNAVYSKSAAMADAGGYTVVVGGAVGGAVTSDVAVVTVVADAFPPAITAQTASPLSAYLGGALNLSVTVSGTEPLACQWHQIAAGVTNALPGGACAAYTKSPVSAGDAGDYFVVVTNGYGTAQSSNVTVSVTTAPLPVITAQTPSPVNVIAGVALNLFATATGTPPLSFQWYKVVGGVTNSLAGATNAAYARYPAAAGDAGEYFVVASNAAGSVRGESIVVSVAAAPSFSSSVTWSWSGASSTTGATVSAKLSQANTSVQLVVSDQPGLGSPVFLSGPVSTDGSGRVLAAASGLSPGRRYYYGFRIGGTDHLAGRMATLFPAGEPASFTFGFASCSDWGNAATFDAIRIQDPWFPRSAQPTTPCWASSRGRACTAGCRWGTCGTITTTGRTTPARTIHPRRLPMPFTGNWSRTGPLASMVPKRPTRPCPSPSPSCWAVCAWSSRIAARTTGG